MEITSEVARLGESLSQRHKDTEKSSCSERRRPRRHHRLAPVSGLRFQHFPSSLMYAGLKRIAPDQDTGMDLNEPWITALELFNAGE